LPLSCELALIFDFNSHFDDVSREHLRVFIGIDALSAFV
jgi:hypothetical protein